MDYSTFREAGHRMVDYIADYLQGVQDKPLFAGADPALLYRLFDEPLPETPESWDEIIRELDEKLVPYCTHVHHKGYMGLITPSPNPAGILADFLASALNQNLGAYSISPSATTMELRVIRWLNDLVGFGPEAGGNLTSGGMTANFIGLKLARDFVSGDRAQMEGLVARYAAYVSEERHVSIDKSADAIGLGRSYLRTLPTNDMYEMDLDALEQAIANDKEAGIRPMCIIGLAGTTNLGAIDDLEALHRIAKRESCWFHVDAAYGGGLLLSPKNKDRLHGIHLADSVTIDPHKWFYAPLDAGAILVRNHDRLTASFGISPAYLTDQSGQKNERYQFFVHGFEQSKRFRSLKVWVSFHHYGAATIGGWIDNNVAQAGFLHQLVTASPDFESATPPQMSAICVRYTGEGLQAAELLQLHREVAARIEKEGRFWFATTEMKGVTWFRINPVNIHTDMATMQDLFHTLSNYCREMHQRMRSGSNRE